ncbi:MAG: NAD(P)-dependent oxidoreductase [Chlorobia bacterium]|nr:NAD(P)-dependent oxidoreductase [Fimbriimonadaceae bacterium]
MSESVGFVGLGTMGAPMAGHLLKSGKRVQVWNRTASKTQPLVDQGCEACKSLEELAGRCAVVFICVNRTEDVQDCLGSLIPSSLPNSLFIDHSTISPEGAKQIHANLKSKERRFIDAPVTGGSMGAQKGQLTIFCGGDNADIEEARPLLNCFAKRVERVGGPGAGQMAKMANQIAVGGALLALCESLSFAKKAGLDVAQIRDLVGGGAGGSWAFEFYGPKILDQDWSPGFSVKNQRKDFGYCLEAADSIDAALPGTQLVDQLLSLLEEEGHGEWTTAALYEIMLRMGAKE